MRLVSRPVDVVNNWRSTDPYHYECTVCGRAFQSEETNCPECGGEVARVTGTAPSNCRERPV